MSQRDYKILVLVLRIIVVILGFVAFIGMFNVQVAYTNGGGGFTTFELVNPDKALSAKPVVWPLIGYIVIILASVASFVMIFVKDMLGGSLVNRIIDCTLGALFLLGAALVVLSVVWYGIINNFNETACGAASIVTCVVGAIASACSFTICKFEEKI